VYKARDKNNNLFAIKHIKFDSFGEGIPPTALREISILKSISAHPFIARYWAVVVRLVKVHYEALEHQLMIVFDYYSYDLKRFLRENK
jgi:serine/threonine protein kinase